MEEEGEKTWEATIGHTNWEGMGGGYSVTHGGSGYMYQSLSSCTYFCFSRDSLVLGRFCRFAVDGIEWTDELFLLDP